MGVVVIGRNEGERLRRCLASGVRESGHLLYVDSGSADGSPALAKSLGVDTLELDPGKPFSAARARNEGIAWLCARAPGLSYVQIVDGDCELHAGWLKCAAEFFDAHPDIAVVSGRLRERNPGASVYNLVCSLQWELPTGEVGNCGGIAMLRVSAFQQAGGFRVDLIAGEEPELCLRLLRGGWRIWRLTQEMAVHDSAMSRFDQWWLRELRNGHAYAEGVALHGAPPERHYFRELRSTLLWGVLLPLVALALSVCFGRWGASVLIAYPVQVVRLALRGERAARENWTCALFILMSKFPAALGVLRYHVRRLLGQQSRLIDYK